MHALLGMFSRHNRFIITGLLVLFSLGFLALVPESDRVSPVFQGFVLSVVFFLVIPLLYTKIVLKESLKNIGWQKGNAVPGTVAAVACVAVALMIVFILIRFSPIREEYVFPALVEGSFFWFVLYELVLVSFVAFLYEVFFRGLVQLLWFRDLGWRAALIQAGLFAAFFFLSGNISWQQAPLLAFAPFAGLVARYSRSIWYSLAASWFFLLLTDVLLLVLH